MTEYPPGEILKTPEEIAELNRLEAEAADEFERKKLAIQQEYGLATHEAWEEYAAVWRPAREKWEAFQGPYSEASRQQMVALNDEMLEIWGKLRKGWRKCPRCGFVNNRGAVLCYGSVGEKTNADGDREPVHCNLNLITGGRR